MPNKLGERELQLRKMREEKAMEVPAVCKIDHTAEGATPQELCRQCNPGAFKGNAIIKPTVKAEAAVFKRDPRVPASCTDAEAKEMMDRWAADAKAKNELAADKRKAERRIKENQKISEADEKRKKLGLPTIAEEREMKKRKSKAKSSKPKAKANGHANGNGECRPGSKAAKVAELLTRKGGCTTKDVLKATGWPSVSMPAQAAAAGLKLHKEKKDGVTYYTGTK